MFENLNAAVVASDADFKVIYQNRQCRKMYKEFFNREDYIGADLNECHSPATTEKLKKFFDEYKEKKRDIAHYVMDVPEGKVTVVDVPFYDGDEFSGVVEFVFPGSLA